MRHRIYGKKLGRNKDERNRLFKNLTASLFTYGTIETSESKAKAIKGFVDRVINLAKEKNISLLQSNLVDKNLKDRLVKEIVPKLGNRNSGYTSLVKLGTRLGDQTMMVRMSLIGAAELKPIEKVIPRLHSGQVSEKGKVISQKTEKTKRVILKRKGRTGRPARPARLAAKRSGGFVGKTKSTGRGTSRLSKTK